MDEITRDHAQKFYKWWSKRLVEIEKRRALTANGANRELGKLCKLYRECWEFAGDENRDNLFWTCRGLVPGCYEYTHKGRSVTAIKENYYG